MIKRLLAEDGVMAVCQFRDNGALAEGYGVLSDEMLPKLARFAHDYKRMVQGNADQLAMFTGMSGWTPPGGWLVKGEIWAVLGVSNLVCVVDLRETTVNPIMKALHEAASW